MDSAVALNIATMNKTKRDFSKLRQDFMDTVYFFHSANSLTLNTASIKNRLTR